MSRLGDKDVCGACGRDITFKKTNAPIGMRVPRKAWRSSGGFYCGQGNGWHGPKWTPAAQPDENNTAAGKEGKL